MKLIFYKFHVCVYVYAFYVLHTYVFVLYTDKFSSEIW